MDFREKLQSGKFVRILENVPPKGLSIDRKLENLRAFKGRIDAATSVDSPLGEARMNPMVFAARALEMGIEPIMHMICRDRNRIGLESDLLAAHAFGIRNILALTGDPAKDAKPVFELNSFTLIELIRKMKDLYGTDFFVGAGLNINSSNFPAELDRAKKKIESGAGFFITQPCFDASVMGEIGLEAPVIAAVLVISDKETSSFFSKVPGIKIPKELDEEIRNGNVVNYYRNLISHLERIADGICLMPIGDYMLAAKLL
jgi:methylenetetrahydrofolate reductase (NADPH)